MSQNVRARLMAVCAAAQLIWACSPADKGSSSPIPGGVPSVGVPGPVTPGTETPGSGAPGLVTSGPMTAGLATSGVSEPTAPGVPPTSLNPAATATVPGETKRPYEFTGKLTGFRMTVTGTVPAAARFHFVNDLESDVTPILPIVLGESVVFSIADAIAPLDWDVANSGERVENGILYSVQVMVPGAEAAGPIDLCISEFEPVYEDSGPGMVDSPFVNRDAFILPDGNSFGIQGPVYAMGDGTSTTQSGNPYKAGKYCVAGEFSRAADAWGAGIAFDLNKAPGGSARSAYTHSGKSGGFRIGLSGNTPGSARIQFIVNEPQDGDQPFLVAQMGTTMDYRLTWAQVPTTITRVRRG